MTTGMLQDTVQTSPSGSGPRFRPYASPTHHVTKGRYITSNDPRGYIPVYEYPLNGQWIMMDIDDGYILWTGIWKALGNSKADIVKMIDSQPDLAPLIRRVRGGYLKIQGTWMPYEVALKLSRRVAWPIRDELIPLFGPTFPSTCLSPDQPGYGQVVPSGQNRRRNRRATQSSVMPIPRTPSWQVVTPSTGSSSAHISNRELPPALHPINVRSSEYSLPSPYQLSPLQSSLDEHHRFGHYNSHPPTAYRSPTSPTSKTGLSLDMRSLSMRESSDSRRSSEDFKLPPIQAPHGRESSESAYALPPITAMEDMRGSITQDSAAVLRRLKMDDGEYPRGNRSEDDHHHTSWGRRHSVSVHPNSSSRSVDTSPRFQPYTSPRSYQDHSSRSAYRTRSPSMSSHPYHRPQRETNSSRPGQVWSDHSHEGDSTSNPSPTSPTTPSSALSENDEHGAGPHALSSEYARGKPYPAFAGRLGQDWPPSHADNHSRMSDGSDREPTTYSIRRNSYEVQSDGDSSVPHRPW
ncbi:hypothetical protein BJ165DRAFT_1070655 [Panaeolus papilionaceus]|nr:hypothetical protein BJ165DRAFT_1070655 [Panaeolus papilionaceus]